MEELRKISRARFPLRRAEKRARRVRHAFQTRARSRENGIGRGPCNGCRVSCVEGIIRGMVYGARAIGGARVWGFGRAVWFSFGIDYILKTLRHRDRIQIYQIIQFEYVFFM